MLDVLQRIVRTLETQDIAYMLSGSLAMGFYTIQRTTRDLDIVIDLQEKHLSVFFEAFSKGYYCPKDSIKIEIARKGMFNLIDFQTGVKIDFMVKKNSPYRNTEFQRRRREELEGFALWVVSLEDLILSKIIWIQELKSERQIEDINNLLRNPDVDKHYLNFWIKDMGLNIYNITI
ncbi:MAG: nucleotidyl transferase AbiEii/AbiGii toxin family protein [Bernardetiaceae bacterium]|nr:nucleotidyl transferase AbiEii/AbiGii toxin family protein [Bernardetiaceae bacterium]